MRIPIGRLLLAVILVFAGAISWVLGGSADALADERERAATLRLDVTSQLSNNSWLARFWTWLDADAHRHAAVNRYWRREFDLDTQPTPDLDDVVRQQIAANAAYRRGRAVEPRSMSLDQIDQALQAYASVLRRGFDRDVAYNYEFLVRQRDLAARARTGAKPSQRVPKPAAPSTIHGRQGNDPPTTKGEEFEVLTPMDYGDREAQPEPTTGRKLPRKG